MKLISFQGDTWLATAIIGVQYFDQDRELYLVLVDRPETVEYTDVGPEKAAKLILDWKNAIQ